MGTGSNNANSNYTVSDTLNFRTGAIENSLKGGFTLVIQKVIQRVSIKQEKEIARLHC